MIATGHGIINTRPRTPKGTEIARRPVRQGLNFALKPLQHRMISHFKCQPGNVSKQCSPCSTVAMGRVERDRFTLLRNWSIGRTRPKKEIEKRRYNVKKKGISFFSYEKNINKAKSNSLIHCTSIWSVLQR